MVTIQCNDAKWAGQIPDNEDVGVFFGGIVFLLQKVDFCSGRSVSVIDGGWDRGERCERVRRGAVGERGVCGDEG